MSSEFINGAKYAFSSQLATAVAITAITNADPAVVTAGTPPTEGDVIILQSGWTDLDDLAPYVGAGNTLLGVDTSDLIMFPPGESAGSYQKVLEWTSLSQIREAPQSGGDTNTFNYAYIDDRSRRQRSKPTDKNPLVITFTMDYDPDLPWYDALIAADKAQKPVVMRETLINGDRLLYTGYLSFQKSPTRTRNENMTVTATMSINSEVLRYPASDFSGS